MFIVYKTTCKVNGKIYIGVHSCYNPDYIGSGKLIKLAIAKYGKDKFVREVLYEFETASEAYAKEKELVTPEFALETSNYNLREGGMGPQKGYKHSDETKTKFRLAAIGKSKSESHKKNIAKFHADVSGENNPMFSKHHSLDTRSKISSKAKNRTKIQCKCGKLVDPANLKRWHSSC